MRSKRVVGAVALLVGIGIGLGAAPLVSGGPAATAAKTYKYTCVKFGAFTEVGIQIYNPGTTKAHVRTFWDDTEKDPRDIISHEWVDTGVDASTSVKVVRFISNRRLMVTATSVFDAIDALWNTPCFTG